MSIGLFCCAGTDQEQIRTLFDILTLRSVDPGGEEISINNKDFENIIDSMLYFAIRNTLI